MHTLQPSRQQTGVLQVQDVGLIFLSAMASDIAYQCHKAGVSAEATLGTALLTLTGSTFLVGLVIIIVGAQCARRELLRADAHTYRQNLIS